MKIIRRCVVSSVILSIIMTICLPVGINAKEYEGDLKKAEWAIEPQEQFTTAPVFSEGFANCRTWSLIINRKGEVVYDYGIGKAPRFSQPYSEGISIGTNSPSGTYPCTAMDRNGNITELRNEEYHSIGSYSCGRAMVSNVWGWERRDNLSSVRCGYLDKDFNLVIPMIYLDARDFSEGYAAVQQENGNWIYIDRDNHRAFDGIFKNAESFSEGLAAVMNEGGLWGYIDYNGKEVIPPSFKLAQPFSDGVAVVSDGTRQGILDPYGNVIWLKKNLTDSYWMEGKFYSSGVCVLRDGDQYGLINTKGQIVIDCGVWDYLSECREGIIIARKDDEKYLLDPKGEIIARTDAIDFRESSENLIAAAVASDPPSEEDPYSGLWGCLRNPEAIPSDWSEDLILQMFEKGYMTDSISYHYQDDITRQEFCDAIVRMVEQKTNVYLPVKQLDVFEDTRDVNIAKLAAAGVVNGISETEFAPDSNLTREQAAKIFMYLGQYFGVLKQNNSSVKFTDDADISDWAYEAVYKMQANGIIQGYEDQSFRPAVHLTKEQAIAMIYRLEKLFSYGFEVETDNPVDTGRITDSWEQIIAFVNDGSYKSKYRIGDVKELDLGSEGIVEMQIAAFDTDKLANGSGKAAITWISKQLLKSDHRTNPSAVIADAQQNPTKALPGTRNVGGWEYSEMRSWLKKDIKPLIPLTVQTAIKPVVKYSTSINESDEVTERNAMSIDDVWIPSVREVFGTTPKPVDGTLPYYETEGPIYTELFGSDEDRIKQKNNTSVFWWLRSATYIGSVASHSFVDVGTDGKGKFLTDFTPVDSPEGVALGFCM